MDSSPDQVEMTGEVVARIQAGDTQAWTELYGRYHDELLFAVRCRLGPGLRQHMQSEDVLQSVLLEALHDLPAFEDRGKGSLKHFLNVLIANKIRDRADTYGAKKRKGTVGITDSMLIGLSQKNQSLDYHDADKFESLERALAQLPEDMRQIVLLRKIDGLSSQEAADILGKGDDACRKLYSRALAKLTILVRGNAQNG